MTNSSTLAQWNDSADWYDKNMGEEGDKLNRTIIRPNVLRVLGNLQGKTLLDVGCGSGYLTSELAKTAEKIVGTDFAPDFVKICREKYKNQHNLSFQVQDVTQEFIFPSESFDIVLCKMVLQYVENIDNFAKESTRLLKMGGKVVVIVDHPFNSQFYYAQSLTGKKNPKYEDLKDYFSREPQTKLSLWGKVKLTWYPKTISDYIQPFTKVGLHLSNIEELEETKESVRIPRILLLEFKSVSTAKTGL
ncbi:class I SAM-dependent methyltransferase [Patescibacteria group bacterium]|nr:class I SAM-dependent methyltransferase [Patescibacteria group bacterium]